MQAESPSCSLMIIILRGFINLLITNGGEHNCEGARNLIGRFVLFFLPLLLQNEQINDSSSPLRFCNPASTPSSATRRRPPPPLPRSSRRCWSGPSGGSCKRRYHQTPLFLKWSIKDPVEHTATSFKSLKCLSLDQRGDPSCKARARKGVSFGSLSFIKS